MNTAKRARPVRILLLVSLLVIALVGLGALLLNAGVFNLSLQELEDRYATTDSKFTDVDGVRLHYMDQGEGPAVLLLHASFMNLRTWDSMAASLAATHRVIRVDLLIAGLTGPDPSDNYSFERNRELVLDLMDQLGIETFSVVGTSSGGIVAFNIAAENPGRIERMVLINSAGMPRTAATNPNRNSRRPSIGNWIRARYMSRNTVREVLDRNFVEPNEPPDWLVDMNYDLWRRDDRRAAGAIQMRNFRTGDPESVLAKVTAPTMVLWGLDNSTVMHLEANVFQHWLWNAPTMLKKYPGVGHYLYLESPDEVETDVGRFLGGQMDDKLVRVERQQGLNNPMAGTRFRDCDDCPEMVVIAPGRFQMGFEGGEPERYEGPVRNVTIERRFAAGRTEITVAEYRTFVEASGYQAARGCNAWDGVTVTKLEDGRWEDPGYGRPVRSDEPAVCVDWTDAQAYVEWLATETGKPYRLLSEAEWEYAADAGSESSFPWGDDPEGVCEFANVFDLDAADSKNGMPISPVDCRDGWQSVAPVGSLSPNAFGLHDMVGNVWEWTADCYVMPIPATPADGTVVLSGECDRRSVKGGSWITRMSRQRPTFRGRDEESLASQIFGFRVARDL